MKKGPIVIPPRGSAPRVLDIRVPEVDASLDQFAEDMKRRRGMMRNRKGQSGTGELRYIGSIPADLYYGNAEFFDDDAKLRQWFKENRAFCTKPEWL